MTMPGRSVNLPSLCAAFAGALLTAGAEAGEGICRESRLPPQDEWQVTEPPQRSLTFEADVDGDHRTDVLTAERYASPGSDVTGVTLRLTKDGTEIHAGSDVSRYWIVAVHPAPPELTGAARTRQRQLVEDALFPAICSRPDPSLSWLISTDKTPVWRGGSPKMPRHYAVYYETPPKGLLPETMPAADGGSDDASHAGPIWVEYAGSAHDDPFAIRPAGRESTGFETLDENDGFRLLATLHGVVLLDKARSRYAWVYVFEGGAKLGVGSILGARIDGTRVTIDVQRFPRHLGRIEIDPASGAYRETWTAVE